MNKYEVQKRENLMYLLDELEDKARVFNSFKYTNNVQCLSYYSGMIQGIIRSIEIVYRFYVEVNYCEKDGCNLISEINIINKNKVKRSIKIMLGDIK